MRLSLVKLSVLKVQSNTDTQCSEMSTSSVLTPLTDDQDLETNLPMRKAPKNALEKANGHNRVSKTETLTNAKNERRLAGIGSEKGALESGACVTCLQHPPNGKLLCDVFPTQ